MNIPPLRQSLFEQMACPYGYALTNIEGRKPPDTAASIRGTEVHRVLASYLEHCAQRHVPMDLAYFDGLLIDTGEEATSILREAAESLIVDWQHFFAAEVSMGLDTDFKPTWSIDHTGNAIEISPLWGLPTPTTAPEYCGIADAIYLYPGGQVATIEDFKSHPRAFPADTFQGKLYALMLFCHMPALEEVTFRLRFVRYANVHTEHKFHREQVPELKEEVRRVRARQQEYHRQYREEGLESMAALPGASCVYCPAMRDFSCPIAKLNPMMNLTPTERLQYRLWYATASRANNDAMRQWVDATGESITATDANGRTYTFGPVSRESTTYPLFKYEDGQFSSPIVEALQDWMYAHPEDVLPTKRSPVPWPAKVRIGATELNSYIKRNKREIVHNNIRDHANIETKIELRVQKEAEVDDGIDEQREDASGNEVAVGDWAP